MPTRRDFVRSAALASAASLVVSAPASALADADPSSIAPLLPPSGSPAEVARDESYWRRVAAQYRVLDRTTNLEAGYFGMMANPVLAAYHRHIDRANRASSFFARREYPAILTAVRQRVADALGAKPTEIAFSRGAT